MRGRPWILRRGLLVRPLNCPHPAGRHDCAGVTRHRDGGTDPTKLLDSAQPGIHRPNRACNTTHIMPPSRICVAGFLVAREEAAIRLPPLLLLRLGVLLDNTFVAWVHCSSRRQGRSRWMVTQPRRSLGSDGRGGSFSDVRGHLKEKLTQSGGKPTGIPFTKGMSADARTWYLVPSGPKACPFTELKIWVGGPSKRYWSRTLSFAVPLANGTGASSPSSISAHSRSIQDGESSFFGM
jgi:hypothetical protein